MIDKVIDILGSNSIEEFFKNLNLILENISERYCILKFDNNLGEVTYKKGVEEDIFIDLDDIQFKGDFYKTNIILEYFGEELRFEYALYLHYNSTLFSCILVDTDNKEAVTILSNYIKQISQRYFEILIKDKRTEVYVEYQKKIDFIKIASNIFKNLTVDDILSTGVALFMDVFSAQASCVIHENKFIPIGVKENDLNEIMVKNKTIYDIVESLENSYYFKEDIQSEKYNIENIFFIYEPKYKLKVILFNISVDFVPDIEFSEIISSILTIAMENAFAHEKMVEMKIHESEMEKTAQILNMFVNKEVSIDSVIKGYGVSIPAKIAGGDFLYIDENDGEIFVCIADVCGKGYSAAVLTVVMSTISEMIKGMEKIDILTLSNTLSDFLLKKDLEGRFITLFLGVIEKDALNFKYISLGHEPVYIVKNEEILAIESMFLPVGIMKEDYEIDSMQLSKNDIVFFYTDGIIEYIDYEVLKNKLINSDKASLEDFVKTLYKECVLDKKHQKDDFTCAILKI